MAIQNLLQQLTHPQAVARLSTARVIGMVQETSLLEAIRKQYRAETDPNVRPALEWAGKRLYQAYKAGFNTVDALFNHFGVTREIENMEDAVEAELIQKMQDDLSADISRSQAKANQRKATMAAGAGVAGVAIAGMGMGASMMAGALAPGAEIASSNIGNLREQISSKRTPAVRPTDMTIDIFVKRLQKHPDPQNRKAAVIEMANINNPKALPYLAHAFATDQSEEVRATAEQFGKVLYWSLIYWEMDESGAVNREIIRRAEVKGIRVPSSILQPKKTTPKHEEDISTILERARSKKGKKR